MGKRAVNFRVFHIAKLLDIDASFMYDKSMKIKSRVRTLAIPNELRQALQNNGTVTTAQANAFSVSNEHLRLLVKKGELERAAFGIYILPDELADEMYIAQLQRPKIIYSHETALYLHGLTDRDPVNYSVTVPTGYNAAGLRDDDFTVFTIKRELHEIGMTRQKTIFGNTVTAYGLERTVCDCLRSRNKMDIAVVIDAVKRYARRKDKNLNTLMDMAEIFQVTKPLRSYMEVLL